MINQDQTKENNRFSPKNEDAVSQRRPSFENRLNIERPKVSPKKKVLKRNSSDQWRQSYSKLLAFNRRHSPLIYKKYSKSHPDEPLKILEYCKTVINNIIERLFSSYDSVPYKIRLFLKIVHSSLMAKESLLGPKPYSKAFSIISEVAFSNWIVSQLFMQPTVYGLMK